MICDSLNLTLIITGALDKNHDHDAACVICQMSSGSVSPYVQWGRKTCSNGAKSEYTGLVMTNFHTNNGRHEYICVDMERAIHKTSQAASEHGGWLMTTEFEDAAVYGLDKYGGNKEIACVLCA